MRRFVIVGQKASASGAFLLDDLPGTSGRLDVLLRGLGAALLVSHGLRGDTVVYLVLHGGSAAPRTVRVDGATARFVRPDERSMATLIKKSLEAPLTQDAGFVTVRPGIAIASSGLDAVLGDIGESARYVLVEGGSDLREISLELCNCTFFVGDHLGFDATTRQAVTGAVTVGVGPVSLHAGDAIVLVANELDRRERG